MMKRVGFQPAGIRLLRERTRQMLADKRRLRRMELERARPAAYSMGMGPLVVMRGGGGEKKRAGAPVNEMRKRSSGEITLLYRLYCIRVHSRAVSIVIPKELQFRFLD